MPLLSNGIFCEWIRKTVIKKFFDFSLILLLRSVGHSFLVFDAKFWYEAPLTVDPKNFVRFFFENWSFGLIKDAGTGGAGGARAPLPFGQGGRGNFQKGKNKRKKVPLCQNKCPFGKLCLPPLPFSRSGAPVCVCAYFCVCVWVVVCCKHARVCWKSKDI